MIKDQEINDFQEKSGLKISKHYQNFLKQNNGYSFKGGVILYSLDELEEMNESLQVQMYQPDYMTIGDDGED